MTGHHNSQEGSVLSHDGEPHVAAYACLLLFIVGRRNIPPTHAQAPWVRHYCRASVDGFGL